VMFHTEWSPREPHGGFADCVERGKRDGSRAGIAAMFCTFLFCWAFSMWRCSVRVEHLEGHGGRRIRRGEFRECFARF